jgi:hypothetical protein
LGLVDLVMQAAQDALPGARVVILHEVHREAGIDKVLSAEGLGKKTA